MYSRYLVKIGHSLAAIMANRMDNDNNPPTALIKTEIQSTYCLDIVLLSL